MRASLQLCVLAAVALLACTSLAHAQPLVSFPTSLTLQDTINMTFINPAQVSGVLKSNSDLADVTFTVHAQLFDGEQMPFYQSVQCAGDGSSPVNYFGAEDHLLVAGQVDDAPPDCVVFGLDYIDYVSLNATLYVSLSAPTSGLLMFIAPTSTWSLLSDDVLFSEDFEIITDGCTSYSGAAVPSTCKPLVRLGPGRLQHYTNSVGVIRFLGSPSTIGIHRATLCGAQFSFTIGLQRKVDCVQQPACDWSACSATCGGGTQHRTLYTVTPALNGGTPCLPAEQTQQCNTDACNVDCSMGDWSDWSACSATCGGGVRNHTRIVESPAQGNGAACTATFEQDTCNTQGCPQDCVPGAWGDWSTCTATCGGGLQVRTRAITTPSANNGSDAACQDMVETQVCNSAQCPVDCVQSDFGPWSACSATCGVGSQTRTRITITYPEANGAACGVASQTQACQDCLCPVDCVVSDWSDWTTCSATCGSGMQNRTRTVVTPAVNGGEACPNLVDTNACNTDACPVDCVTGEWSDWGTCSATCGTGTQTRSRPILVAPLNGGAACDDCSQTQNCNTQGCPVDCDYSDWTPVGTCSATCGGGKQQYTRSITCEAANGGAACGDVTKTEDCNTQACPIDCVLGDWGAWSTCDVACGGGFQTRNRPVLVEPCMNGAACNITYDVQRCNTQVCDVDCSFGPWSAWGNCSKPCGGGHAKRTLPIYSQAQGNGAACPVPVQFEQCNTQGCATDCVMSDWTPWSLCSASCGNGTQSRYRSIVTPSANGGDSCPEQEDTQVCNTDNCPIDCAVSEWTAWSTCSAQCGTGTQTRSRVITTEPQYNGASCPILQDVQNCNTPACPVDCVMDEWSDWSSCSATCGGGVQNRTRSIRVEACNGGAKCEEVVQTQSCNSAGCPVDCVVSDWSAWSTCDQSCGSGQTTRTRSVITHAANGGQTCPQLSESNTCNTQNCPVDCQVSGWTDFGSCSATCGGGKWTRTRSIVTPPSYGGAACPSDLTDTESCNTQGCPIDCVQSAWGAWSTCSATCGTGTQQRTRSIVTAPANGGAQCDVDTQFQSCNTQQCGVDCEMSEWHNLGGCSRTCGGGYQIQWRSISQWPKCGGAECGKLVNIVACNTQACDTDCQMGDWSCWSKCSATCGGGTQTRSRSVAVHQCGKGASCPAETQTQACNTQACDNDCKLGDWSAWGTCSKSCGGGTQTRTRSVLTQQCGRGKSCDAVVETQACNTRQCAVDCVMGAFGPFSTCTKTCGGGTQTRQRAVVTPASNGGKACGCLYDQEACNTQKCEVPPVDCVVSDWGSWSTCSATCGGGVSTRTRTITVQPTLGGKTCPALSQTMACNTASCKVDCKVGDWSGWGKCSKTCGGGTQTRSRSIVTKSCSGGADCPALTDSQACNTQSCNSACKVSDWSAWSTCSKDCGGGVSYRTRTVTQAATGKGCSCPALKEYTWCNQQACNNDCKVSDWSSWGQCSQTCGGGKQTRTRSIVSKSCGGGASCPTLTDTQTCNTAACPVDCVVSGWGAWGQCSKDCAGGVSTRSRVVLTQPLNGGAACPALTDSTTCNTQKCTQDCIVSDWSSWGTCSATCGTGTQTRSRKVLTPCNGGANCPALTDSQKCNTQACKQDCVVSDWSSYSTCSATCGGGVTKRTRTIVTQPSGGGCSCPALTETSTCNSQTCAKDCAVSDWSAWGTCSKTCGGGSQTRTRKVTSSPCSGGASCPALTQSQQCNTQACVTDCKLSDWSCWGTCSKSCGGGTQTRKRTVLTYPCSSGAACGALTDSQACNTQQCTTDCAVSDWSSWSSCSKTCGGGVTTRTRKVTTSPCSGGASCPALTETDSCNTQACKQDCAVSDWSSWGTCSKTCGGGTQTRTRSITSSPCSGGASCPTLTDSQTCNTASCGTGQTCASASNVKFTVSAGAVVATYDIATAVSVSVKISYGGGKSLTLPFTQSACKAGTSLNFDCASHASFPKGCGSYSITQVTVSGTSCTWGSSGEAPIPCTEPAQSCAWAYSAWGACSNSCGSGSQSRTGKCQTAAGVACDANKCGTAALVQSCSDSSACGMSCTATSCSGDGSTSTVKVTQGNAGTLDVALSFTKPNFGNLRGFFIDFPKTSRLYGQAAKCSILGTAVTTLERNVLSMGCDNSISLSGCSNPSTGTYDLAVALGNGNFLTNNIASTAFTINCSGYTLTPADVTGARIGVRAINTGIISFLRIGSAKQTCTLAAN